MRVKAQVGLLRHRFRKYTEFGRPRGDVKGLRVSYLSTLGPGLKNERIRFGRHSVDERAKRLINTYSAKAPKNPPRQVLVLHQNG